MQDINELAEYLQEEESVNIKEFLFRMLSKWRWFVCLGFLGLVAGYFISRSTPPTYKITGTVLVNSESKGMDMESLFEGFSLGDKANIENHILMLQSYTLNREALENLGWDVSWYREGYFRDEKLYRARPFELIRDTSFKQLKGLRINVEVLSGDGYLLSVDDETMVDGAPVKVKFEANGLFGVPFKNQYFAFTLNKRVNVIPEVGEQYYLRFNDINDMTLSYQGRLEVSQSTKKADGISLTLVGENPRQQVDYMNELIQVYMAFGLRQKNRTSENTVRFIDGQLTQIVDSLNIAGKSFTEFRSRRGIVDLSQEAGLVVQKLEDLESERAMAQRRVAYYRNLQTYMGNASQMKMMVAPSVMGIVDPALNAQVVKLGELYSKRSTLSFVAREDNPGMQMVEQEIDNTLRSLSENLRNLLSHATVELSSLDERMARINVQLAGLPKTEQELINIKRRFDLNNELYTFLLTKRAEASITTAANVPDAQVLDPARLETAVRVGPRTMINLIIGLVLGLGIPFVVIVVVDYFNDTIQSKEQLEKECKLPIVGQIAHNNYKSEIPVMEHSRSGIAETFRGLRVNLGYLYKGDGSRVLAVHSMVPGEGKTFTSLNLAGIIALDNKKVLLVGCDLRKPRLHQVFGDNNHHGLSTYLIGKDVFEDILIPTSLAGLSYVSSGPIPPNPSELIGNGEFHKFIEQAREQFDYIVLDNAPVTLVTDGILVGDFADVNLFVLRQDYSNKDQIKFINQLGEKESLGQIGVVLNDTVYNGYGNSYGRYGYGGYGSYGYGYGYYDEDHQKRGWKERIRVKAKGIKDKG